MNTPGFVRSVSVSFLLGLLFLFSLTAPAAAQDEATEDVDLSVHYEEESWAVDVNSTFSCELAVTGPQGEETTRSKNWTLREKYQKVFETVEEGVPQRFRHQYVLAERTSGDGSNGTETLSHYRSNMAYTWSEERQRFERVGKITDPGERISRRKAVVAPYENILPSGPVSTGDTWEVDVSSPARLRLGILELSSLREVSDHLIATLDGVESTEEGRVATITLRTESDSAPENGSGQVDLAGQFQMNVTNGKPLSMSLVFQGASLPFSRENLDGEISSLHLELTYSFQP